MLHGLLDRFPDAVPGRVVADRDGRHPLVESDHEGIEGDADRDQAEAARLKVGEAEPEDQGVRDHEDAIPHGLELAPREIDELERGLECEAGEEEPHARDAHPTKLTERPTRDDHHDDRGDQGQDEQPHNGERSGRLPGPGAYDANVAELEYSVSGGIARLTINRPERRNAVSFDVMRGLRDGLADARTDDEVRVVVITGAGEQAFCAGADLTGIADNSGAIAAHDGRGAFADLFRDLWSLGKPTIARVRGYALAGGFGLAMSCDFVIAADDAQFGTPEVNVGLWPYMITIPLLRSIPPRLVLELMMTGRRVDATEAERVGLVNRVVPVAELDAQVDALAHDLASKSPLVLRLGKTAFQHVLDLDADHALDYLQAMLTVTTLSEDAAEGVAAFAAKRAPRWTGR